MTGLFKHWRQTIRRVFPEEPHRLRKTKARLAWLRLDIPPLNSHWIKRHGLSLLGWPAAAGVGLLSLCAMLYFSTILPMQEKLASTRQNVLALQEQIKRAGLGVNASQRTPEEQLAEFYRMFPDGSNLPVALEKIFALAQSQGIGLNKGEYKVTSSKDGSLVSFQVILPVKGQYPQIRKYLTSLRNDIPVLSLQQVQFKRQKVGDSVVEANIRLGLYLLGRKS